jgi:purine catabolism regulator
MTRFLDVGAVLDALPGEARLLAGAGGLSRSVGALRSATSVDQARRATADELLVLTVADERTDDAPTDELLADLEQKGVAGLVMRAPVDTSPLRRLVAAADERRMPIIALPTAVGPDDATGVVLEAMLAAQNRRLDRALGFHQRYAPVASVSGLTEVVADLSSMLRCTVAVVDALGTPLVVVPEDGADRLDLTVVDAVRQPVMADDREHGVIVALTESDELDDDGRMALHSAARAIAGPLAYAASSAAEQDRFAAISLEELLAGRAGDRLNVIERASSFGWDLARPRAVLLASVDPWTERAHLATSLVAIAAAARATLGRDAIVWTRSSSVAALVAPDSSEPGERRAIAEELRRELDERVTLVTVSIGVGRRVADPVDLPRSYVDACRAVDVGRWAKGRHATEVYDELGLERLLASTPPDDLAEFVEAAIGHLVDHDRSAGTDLVATLGTWLETRNMAEAARRLHVHYNTLKNRLDRIETIIGPITSDGARSLECAVAIYVSRHYDGPWTAGGGT